MAYVTEFLLVRVKTSSGSNTIFSEVALPSVYCSDSEICAGKSDVGFNLGRIACHSSGSYFYSCLFPTVL